MAVYDVAAIECCAVEMMNDARSEIEPLITFQTAEVVVVSPTGWFVVRLLTWQVNEDDPLLSQ